MTVVTEIVPDVYNITMGEIPDARWRVFLFDRDVPRLVDTDLEDIFDTVAAALDEMSIVPRQAITTHGGSDHIGSHVGLVDRYDFDLWVPTSVDTLANVVKTARDFVVDHLITELDITPVLAGLRGTVVLDALVVLEDK